MPTRSRSALIAALAILSVVSVSAQTGSVDFTASRQEVEGFGASSAFGQANAIRKLPLAAQRQILDLLFSRETGAGLSMYRLGILTDSDIEPTAPASPAASPAYTFDGSDGGQVWLAQQAQKYGTLNFIADAWTAPAYMKSNNSTINGGYLCGVPGVKCPSGDWRQPFADYLLQYLANYKSAGIPISALAFTNEPDEALGYASMLFTPDQAVDFIKILGPTIARSSTPTRLHCCDSSRWLFAVPFTTAIHNDAIASSFVDVIAAHEYGAHANAPQPTTKPVWMTEWSSGNAGFEPLWDCGDCAGGPDGMYLANDIIQAFNKGNISAYVYWWATSTEAAGLIQVTPTGFTVAARFYAFASLSRFVRPGAHVVASTNTDPALNFVAFRNPDGSKVLTILNTSRTASSPAITIDPGAALASPRAFLTDATHHIAETQIATLSGQTLNLALPPRSLTTVFFPAAPVKGRPTLESSIVLQRLADGTVQAALKIANTGAGTAQDIQLTTATLGSATAVPAPGRTLPLRLGSIAGGGFLIVPLNFPSTAGKPHTIAGFRISGAFNGGSFNSNRRTKLP